MEYLEIWDILLVLYRKLIEKTWEVQNEKNPNF